MDPVKKERDFPVSVKDISAQEPRTLLITGSTETTDRDGDILLVSGWKTENYVKNPVVLWAHDYSKLPVGTARAVYVDQRAKQLAFKVYFPTVEELSTKGQPPSEHALFVDTVYNMYKNGILNAVSVGYMGVKMEPRRDQEEMPVYARGLLFTEQELVELSCVPVPANAEALVQARGMKAINPQGLGLVEQAIKDAAQKAASELAEKSESKGEEDMADKLTDEEVTKLKAFLGKLTDPPAPAVEAKANRKLSAASLARVSKAIEYASGCAEELKALVSDGVEEQDDEASDGVEKAEQGAATKAFDLATMSVEQANDILRLGGNHEGA